MFSSARSFSPPVGSHIEADTVAGYYIDFSRKVREPRWPPYWMPPGGAIYHVSTAQWALGCYERYRNGEGAAWLDAAVVAGDHLLDEQHDGGPMDGGWVHRHRMPHSYDLSPPWLSAMAQGEAASLLVRIFRETADERFADAARRALRPFDVPSARGGVLATLDGGPFFEEYPTIPPSYVLNGELFALWGCYDVATALDDDGARTLFDAGIKTLADHLHHWDTGYWSRYDLFPHPTANLASGAYHLLHVNQLRATGSITSRPEFRDLAERFEGYAERPSNRGRALASKVGFRVLVPRNRLLAHRMPWAHRGPTSRNRGKRSERSDVLVLCYHAVGERWPAELSVLTRALEEQLAVLMQRGYRGVTFTEAVSGRPAGKVVAVTFDDGYRSIIDSAFPVLSGFDLPGSVFVPTSFVGSPEPMSWPGIDQWSDDRHRGELMAMSWDELRTIADAGWEIGSHTHTHPLLTKLSDSELAGELRESRAVCESNLDRPCRALAYPYGAFDSRVIDHVREAGYTAAGTMPARLKADSPLAWPRTAVYRGDELWRFKLKVSRAGRRARASRLWVGRGAPDELTQTARGTEVAVS